MEIYHPAEMLSRDELAALQCQRLRETVRRARDSRFYRQRLDQAGVAPESIRSLDDLARIPPTTKQDLRDSYPDGMVAVPQDRLVRLHASSGTTGSATVIYHTREDIETWAQLMARCMHMAGVRPWDVFQNTSGYGLFTGGLGIHYGAEALGCLTIPSGPGNTRRQLKLIRDFGVTVLHIIPSYALYLGDAIAAEGLDPATLSPRIALIGAEPHSEEVRRRIETLLGLKAYNSYGLSEMNGPGVAFECQCQDGMHLWEDAFIAEILDPDTGQPVPEGEVGELVMTCLTRTGMPILRYKTRDLTRFVPGVCACGRQHRRIDRIKGRADDMLIIKGVNIYPMQVEQALMALPEVGQNYQIVLTHDGRMDQLTVQVELREDFFQEDMRALTGLQKKIAGILRDEILVTPRVELVQANTLPRTEGKAVRVLDNRTEG